MKRVIDVSETLYQTCTRLVNAGDARPSECCIADSKPLDDITEEWAIDVLRRHGWFVAPCLCKAVQNERPKGEWVPMNPDCRGYSDYFKCSICGAYIYPNIPEKELDYNGCPYCFADMRGEENDKT